MKNNILLPLKLQRKRFHCQSGYSWSMQTKALVMRPCSGMGPPTLRSTTTIIQLLPRSSLALPYGWITLFTNMEPYQITSGIIYLAINRIYDVSFGDQILYDALCHQEDYVFSVKANCNNKLICGPHTKSTHGFGFASGEWLQVRCNGNNFLNST
jgi:hypothetical protein